MDEAYQFNRAMDQAFQDLGHYDHNMSRDRPYTGQPHTDTGIRGKTEIRGITFRDLRDGFIRAVLLSTGAETIDGVDLRPRYEEATKGERATLCENDLYGFNLDKLDPMAIFQSLSCEVEKMMGIYPNVSPLIAISDIEEALSREEPRPLHNETVESLIIELSSFSDVKVTFLSNRNLYHVAIFPNNHNVLDFTVIEKTLLGCLLVAREKLFHLMQCTLTSSNNGV